jgi:CheY-like chemotaxis protein/DNA-binding CsgD family transcriptional regulator
MGTLFEPVVMIIDDTPGNLALLSDTLSEAGYRVLVATDGLSALEQINYLRPDIILLDVMMPGVDGFETCRQLKVNPHTAAIPVIFMTALGELDDLLRGFNEGAVDYLVKPISPPEVLARVESHLKQAFNFQRAEMALNNSPFAVMTVSKEGLVTWLPESGKNWLAEYAKRIGATNPIQVGGLLPLALASWLQSQPFTEENKESTNFESSHQGVHFSIKRTVCQHTGEYLLLMEKHSKEWDLESLRHSLSLTFREAEILMWISRGKTNKEMGVILGTSPRTINKHLEHIFEKLGVVTRAAAVSMALQTTGKFKTEID